MPRIVKPLIGVTLVLFLYGCSTRTPTPTVAAPTATPAGQGQRGLALVDSITVSVPDGTRQALVVARGSRPDNCTTLADHTVEFQPRLILISLYQQRQPAADCTGDGQAYTHEMTLEVADLAGGDYTVVVNGSSATLTLEGAPVEGTPQAQEPTPVPATPEPTTDAPTPEPTQAGGVASNCIDKAAFYGDVTIPDNTAFKQGEAFTKVWKVRNEGTCTWRGYRLVFAGGDQMSGATASELPVVPPETTIEISLDLVAPTRGGTYLSNWEFEDAEGRRFGVGASRKGPIWVQVAVNFSGQEETVPPLEQVGASPPAANPNACGATVSADFQQEVLRLINAERAARGLPTLSEQSQLAAAARQQSQDMACHNFISHTGTDGTSWKHRVANQGYANYNSAREIIYAGDVSFGAAPTGALDWWMNSQVHHDIILFPSVSEIGVACAINPAQPGMAYYTVVFARP